MSLKFARALGVVGSALCTANVALALPLTQWETYVPGEEQEALDTTKDLMGFMKKDYTDQDKRMFRDAHPRGIGCVAAKFTVNSDLGKIYQTGVFAKPGKSYDAIIRFSGSLGPAGDNVTDARGMAIKLFDVPGTKLLEDQPNAVTHDFIQINAPTFPAPNAHDFAGLIKIKANPAYILRFLAESPIGHALVLKNALALGGKNPNNGKSLAEMQFFSMSPYLLKGDAINTPIKFSSRPCGPVSAGELNGSETELRDDLQERLSKSSLCFKFALQFFTPGRGLEVEDASDNWTTDKAPFIDFAEITIPQQNFRTDQKLRYCDALSFQPWHAIAQHQPLGNINRVRKIVYETISNYRHKANMEAGLYAEPVSLAPWNALTDSTYSVWKDVKIPAAGH